MVFAHHDVEVWDAFRLGLDNRAGVVHPAWVKVAAVEAFAIVSDSGISDSGIDVHLGTSFHTAVVVRAGRVSGVHVGELKFHGSSSAEEEEVCERSHV